MSNSMADATTVLNERSRATIGRDIAQVRETTEALLPRLEATVSTARALRSWLDDRELLRQPRVVVPHFAVQGRVTLLSGREKIGKSTLVATVVVAASRGDSVLGVPIERPVRVLWYALDEHVADAVRRFQSLGAGLDQIVVNDAPRTQSELLSALEVDLAKFPDVNLVVVDTLSRVFASSGVDPNSSHDVEPVIARLVDFFHRRDISTILLYHTGKGGREYRGSTAIGATVDDILTLRRRGQAEEDDFEEESSDDGRRLLVQEGRNLRGRLQLTCSNGVYRMYEDALPRRQRILESLRDHGSIAGRGQLVKSAGVQRASGLRTVTELIVEGAIIETGKQLKLSPSGEEEIGSRAQHVHDQPSGRAPAVSADRFPDPQEFQPRGTSPEPNREPRSAMQIPYSSRFPHRHPAETGTASPTESQAQRRVLI